MTTQKGLLETPLHAVHVRLGARMVDFAGWDMPVQYPTGIIAEHTAVRTDCGRFDLSHMGRVFLRGADALALAQECCTRDLARLGHGEAAYALLCNDDGGIVDDVICYVLDDGEILFVFNASNRETDVAFFTHRREQLRLNVEITDQTFDTALIGLQGPRAEDILQPLCTAQLNSLPGYRFVYADVAGPPALVARTGYTGEDGFEIMVESQFAERVWDALGAACPAGLGARDTLRTEAGMALYGHEIDLDTNPYEARLGWVVNLGKSSFVGRDALTRLKAEGPKRRLVGLRVAQGGVPRPGFPILHDGVGVGALTSGTFSPTLKQNIGIGYVPTQLSEPGRQLQVEMRGKPVAAEVTKLPFVPNHARPRTM
jgi:glycine cleavage system T protein (aminomethyltransferase)